MKISLGSMSIALFFLASEAIGAESIDVKIAAIAAAPTQERAVLMNALKLQITQMNEKDREAALSQLKVNRDNAQNSATHQTMPNRMQQMNTQQGGTISVSNAQNVQSHPSQPRGY